MTDEHFYNDLDATLGELWRRLARGVADRRSGFHTVQLASIGLDGAPRALHRDRFGPVVERGAAESPPRFAQRLRRVRSGGRRASR